jgi:poly-beta-hydroxyalkanoate depolymerase
MPVILDYIARYVYSIDAAGAGVRVMCICWPSPVLLPCIVKMELTYRVGEGPTSMEMAGCVSWVKYTVEVAPYDDFPMPSL